MTGLDIVKPPDWTAAAVCAQTDPESFYPEKGGSNRPAKSVCNGTPAADGRPALPACPVRTECLEYALANDERFGIWGGLSDRERARLRQGLRVCRDCGVTFEGRKQRRYCNGCSRAGTG